MVFGKLDINLVYSIIGNKVHSISHKKDNTGRSWT